MKKTSILILTILLLGFTVQTKAQNNDAKLSKVSITFVTHNDNKDHDTRLNVGGDMEFVDPSTHSFDLTLSSS